MEWGKAQDWELNWWNNFRYSYKEPLKQEVYASKMGLDLEYPDFDLKGKSVLDVGGGPTSMLLKFKNHKGTVADPLLIKFPLWVKDRYEANGIDWESTKGEELRYLRPFDEVWIYNCLQHTENPQKVIENAKKAGKLIRIFEWINEPISDGHLHTLKENELNEWLGGKGKVEMLSEKGCFGMGYYGIF
jgi:2-polyprenyl-3-methyl-5-hydroxy-6-metoxy-1,4-benzoquinol methylase